MGVGQGLLRRLKLLKLLTNPTFKFLHNQALVSNLRDISKRLGATPGAHDSVDELTGALAIFDRSPLTVVPTPIRNIGATVLGRLTARRRVDRGPGRRSTGTSTRHGRTLRRFTGAK